MSKETQTTVLEIIQILNFETNINSKIYIYIYIYNIKKSKQL